jgi:DmsE family decaheme c-type cytochrome
MKPAHHMMWRECMLWIDMYAWHLMQFRGRQSRICNYSTGKERQLMMSKQQVIWAFGALLGLLLAGPATAQQSSPNIVATYTKKGADACLYCHNVERLRLIAKTRHGDKNNQDSPAAQHDCESCHGPGSLHSTRSRRGRGRPSMYTFGKEKRTPPIKQAQVCQECHAKDMGNLKGLEWEGSVHGIKHPDKEQMSCSSCHVTHASENPLKNKAKQAEICYSCHEKMKAEHPRFEDVGINIDDLSCWDCHDVHQLIPEEKPGIKNTGAAE